MKKPSDVAEKLLNSSYEALDEREKKVALQIADRKHNTSNPNN